jgi:hypothetical protein
MASGHDYIPTKDADFDAWFRNLCAYIVLKVMGEKVVWPHIPTAAVEELLAALKVWHEAYEAVLKPHTPVETEAKNDARKAAEAVIRPFKRRYLDDLPVTDEDRRAMGTPIHDGTRTPDKEPDTVPEAETVTSKIRHLIIRFKDQGAESRAKPDGTHGAEFRWNIQDTVPVHIETELIHTGFDTASPFTLAFDEADRGKRVYYALRWVSTTTLVGGWSEIYSAIIP